MHGQQNDKYTEMHGLQNVKTIRLFYLFLVMKLLIQVASTKGNQ